MKEFLDIMQTWSGIFLLLVLAVIGIICSLAGSSSSEERRLSGIDDDHYVLRLPIGRVVYPLMLLVIGAVLEFVCNYVQDRFFKDMTVPFFAGKLAIGFIFGLLFWTQLAKVLRSRVFVNGDKIVVTPAIGAPIETNFKQIRTVANKLAGRDRGVIGKKIRTKEGNRFEVINTMAGYERFCIQLEEKVELPNLTKKIFKKRDKKVTVEKEPEETVSHDPLPQASPAAYVPENTENTGEKQKSGGLFHKLGSFADSMVPDVIGDEKDDAGVQESAAEKAAEPEMPETIIEEVTETEIQEPVAEEAADMEIQEPLAEEAAETEVQEPAAEEMAETEVPELTPEEAAEQDK